MTQAMLAISATPQGADWLATVSLDGSPLVQNIYALPMSGTILVEDSLDGGATWLPLLEEQAFALTTESLSVLWPITPLPDATHRRVTSSPTGSKDVNACGLSVTVLLHPPPLQ